MSASVNYVKYEQKCKILINDPSIRLAALIDPMGNYIIGEKKKGLELLETKEEQKKLFMEIVLRVTSRKDFDNKLGPVTYASSRREKVVILTFPMGNHILLVSAETSVNIEEIATKILKLFS